MPAARCGTGSSGGSCDARGSDRCCLLAADANAPGLPHGAGWDLARRPIRRLSAQCRARLDAGGAPQHRVLRWSCACHGSKRCASHIYRAAVSTWSACGVLEGL